MTNNLVGKFVIIPTNFNYRTAGRILKVTDYMGRKFTYDNKPYNMPSDCCVVETALGHGFYREELVYTHHLDFIEVFND